MGKYLFQPDNYPLSCKYTSVAGLVLEREIVDETIENVTLEECCDAAWQGKFSTLQIPAIGYLYEISTQKCMIYHGHGVTKAEPRLSDSDHIYGFLTNYPN